MSNATMSGLKYPGADKKTLLLFYLLKGHSLLPLMQSFNWLWIKSNKKMQVSKFCSLTSLDEKYWQCYMRQPELSEKVAETIPKNLVAFGKQIISKL